MERDAELAAVQAGGLHREGTEQDKRIRAVLVHKVEERTLSGVGLSRGEEH